MKTKFKKLLSDKVKDYGLSDKAIEELVESGVAGLADGATDEEIASRVNFVIPFAKAMQGEYTRKVQEAKKQQQSQQQSHQDGDGEGEQNLNKIQELINAAMKPHMERIAALETENTNLKAQEAKKAREAQISAKAKELGIPEFLMKRVSFADDADYEKELTAYKQDLVNNKLMPADSAGEQGTQEKAMSDAAKAWAESLPSK